MTASQMLVPLRVPELGPSLGKIMTGTGRPPNGLSLEVFRLQLANRMVSMAGEARRLAEADRQAALAVLGRDAWQHTWDEIVDAVAGQLVATLSRHLDAEAAAVRMPKRRRRRLDIDAHERRAIAARLGTAGAGLIPALDAIEASSAPLVDATRRQPLFSWQEAQTVAARRLEASWIALERAVDAELEVWRRVADGVAGWHRPLWPSVLIGLAVVGSALYGAVLAAGYLPVPRWMSSVVGALRGLIP